MRHDASEEAAETAFLALVDSLDASTKATRRFREIAKEADESGDYQTALEQLTEYVAQREEALDRVKILNPQEGVNILASDAREVVEEIYRAESNVEQFLGNGAVAEVYTLKLPPSKEGWVCVKVVKNYERYAEGGLTTDEMRFLDTLHDLRVEGVRTPMPFFAFSSMRMDGIAMEHLDAFNMRRILEGQTTEGIKDELPDRFSAKTFFERLRAYVKAMHKRGIVHNDLHLRNLMVDRTNGNPYVIDFGKAKDLRTLDRTRDSERDWMERDFEALRLAEAELRTWIHEKGLTDKK